MLRNILLRLTVVFFLVALLGACDNDNDTPTPPPNNNWDSITWDQDNWS